MSLVLQRCHWCFRGSVFCAPEGVFLVLQRECNVLGAPEGVPEGESVLGAPEEISVLGASEEMSASV